MAFPATTRTKISDSPETKTQTGLKRLSLRNVVILTLLAFILRIHFLGASPYRGDEAFTVRYWAAPPTEVLSDLAWKEPHPLGIFFAFWGWKSLVGDSEFAMRMLSVLANLLGVAAMYALTRRLLNSRTIALTSAFLWSINPNLIW